MFLDEKKYGEIPAITDIFSVQALARWIETKDPTQTYCYEASGECLISQYFQENGFPQFHCGPLTGHWYDQRFPNGPLPKHFNNIAKGCYDKEIPDHTFGAALERARAVLASR